MRTMTRPAPQHGGRGPLSSRGGTMAVAAITALLAAAALLVFLGQYRSHLTDSTPQRVLVARSLVPKGTPGAVVASSHLYKQVKMRKSQVKDGAISDPAALEQRVATQDVYPGQPLTTKAFAGQSTRVLNHLSGYQRAISVPVDGAHGLIGKVEPGDHVDVIGTFGGEGAGPNAAVVVARNALVLSVPSKAKSSGVTGTGSQSATVRVSDEASAQVAAAADGGKVWLVLRPAVGARSHGDTLEAFKNGKHIKAKITVDAQAGGGR
jgi:pilus assembly protein CpaB